MDGGGLLKDPSRVLSGFFPGSRSTLCPCLFLSSLVKQKAKKQEVLVLSFVATCFADLANVMVPRSVLYVPARPSHIKPYFSNCDHKP